MIDPLSIVRSYLASIPSIADAFTGGIVAGPELPAGYTISSGPLLVFNQRGGELDYHNQTSEVSLQFRVFDSSLAKSISSASIVFDAINDSRGPQIKWIRQDSGTVPTPLVDPSTGWSFVLMFFSALLSSE